MDGTQYCNHLFCCLHTIYSLNFIDFFSTNEFNLIRVQRLTQYWLSNDTNVISNDRIDYFLCKIGRNKCNFITKVSELYQFCCASLNRDQTRIQMKELTSLSANNIVVPILTILRNFGFKQCTPQIRVTLSQIVVIWLMRMIFILTLLTFLISPYLTPINQIGIGGLIQCSSLNIIIISLTIIYFTTDFSDILDNKLELSMNSYRSLRLRSNLLLFFIAMNYIADIALDIWKFFYFPRQHALISLSNRNNDNRDITGSFLFVVKSLMHFTCIHSGWRFLSAYCVINCWVISKMFVELNTEIMTNKYRPIAYDILVIQKKHNNISIQAINLSNKMSNYLLVAMLFIIINASEYTFYIISYFIKPDTTGKH